MTETTLQRPVTPAAPRPDSAGRGHLTIADRVIEKTAARAAADIASVISSRSSLRHPVAGALPRADVRRNGRRVRVRVLIAVAWPASLPEVARAVRNHVSRQVQTLLDLPVEAVDVIVSRVVFESGTPDDEDRRVR
ncbi:Asp23/Gls24 family envelope stress response protein [Kineosporia succinea]|uniref:Alkaline shock family protein YloU n=1 Tax=Kineosporia succinea TaxID=84632 RepID=A0ABT9P9X6_9ACTN|nr:Asp23/Gls24 family envelope stress response protein [Kineosporia succinea]MDP9829494.1 putative alkaline shock family protein YloU [Kineosporia succinea]